MKGRELGARGENVAVRHLESKGYRILERNWHATHGELDLVALDGETVVVVEVKTRSGGSFGPPEEAMTRTKRRRLLRTAWTYLQEHELLESSWRVDVIAIEMGRHGAIGRLDHYQNVVSDDPEARK